MRVTISPLLTEKYVVKGGWSRKQVQVLYLARTPASFSWLCPVGRDDLGVFHDLPGAFGDDAAIVHTQIRSQIPITSFMSLQSAAPPRRTGP